MGLQVWNCKTQELIAECDDLEDAIGAIHPLIAARYPKAPEHERFVGTQGVVMEDGGPGCLFCAGEDGLEELAIIQGVTGLDVEAFLAAAGVKKVAMQ